jgi:hypothetical protein
MRESFLVGTAHFSPYSFKGSLSRLLKESEYALFEGPLDPSSMERVVAAGMAGENTDSFLDELDAKTIEAVAQVLGLGGSGQTFLFALPGTARTLRAYVAQTLGDMKPWMTFFSIYTAYLRRNGWKHSVDMEAYTIATELGKTVVFMETIEEQIQVLETVSRRQIVDFMRRIDSWPSYTRDFMRWYLNADLAQIELNPYGFPTRTPRLIDCRDTVFCERMQPYLERGGAAVFVGAPHIPGVRRILMDAGYEVDDE